MYYVIGRERRGRERKRKGKEKGIQSEQTGMIAADVEVTFVGVAIIVDDTGLEVVAAWRGDCCVAVIGGIRSGEGEGEG